MGKGGGMSLSRRAFTAVLGAVPLAKGQMQMPSAPALPAGKPLSDWRAKVFDSHELETVAAVAEVIIPPTDTPGARAAAVHQHLDDIMAASPETVRSQFLEGLWWLDGYCMRTKGKPFTDVSSADEQRQILVHLYESQDPELRTGAAFVQLAKSWTAKIYYSSEIGNQELNKGGRVPSSYAGNCSA
jgi:glucoside 3-dehydrogenase (cytochrome c) hitch-hiker subunit